MTCRPISLLMHHVCPKVLLVPLLGSILALAGCTASAVEVEPPQYELYFPTGMTISDDDRYLFVVSANADLRYSAGAVQTLDLDAIDAAAAGWKAVLASTQDPPPATPAGCTQIPTRPTVLGCPLGIDGGVPPIMVPGGSVQIGNFGTAIAAQRLTQDGAASSTVRLFSTVRGDPSITWVDFDAAGGEQKMSCGESGSFPRCAESHRIARIRNDADLPSLTPEPFYLYLDAVGENVFVTHFTSGFVSLVSAPGQVGSTPLLQDTLTSLWAPSRTTGLIGAAGIAARPGDPSGLVYVTSRYEARIALVAVAQGPDVTVGDETISTRALVRTGSFFLDGLEQSGLAGDARSLTFTPDGNRAFVISRVPPSLQLFDTSLDLTGAPRNRLLDLVELCDQPANLALADLGAAGRIVAVPCFVNGQVWIVDADTLRLIAIEESGRGPNGIVVSAARKKLYVGNYAEDTITVIDLDPASRTRNRAILRLGSPRPLEERN